MKYAPQEAYQAAVEEGIYPEGSYIIVNEHEYFATGGGGYAF